MNVGPALKAAIAQEIHFDLHRANFSFEWICTYGDAVEKSRLSHRPMIKPMGFRTHPTHGLIEQFTINSIK